MIKVFKKSIQSFFCQKRSYHLNRSLFYVPADNERKVSKILTASADTCVLELEDGVAINRKAAAREGMKRFLTENQELITKENSPKLIVGRVNSPQSDFFDDDMEACLSVGDLLKTVLIPKVSSKKDVEIILKRLAAGPANGKTRSFPIGVITYAETAEGLNNLERVCEGLMERQDLLEMQAVVFGSDDYCADIGAPRSEHAEELIYARQKVVAVARGFGLQPIDMVYIDIANQEGLLSQSEQGFRFGFAGKQCIHPSQVDIINDAFTPSEESLSWAVELIAKFEEHQQSGSGAFVFRQQMIDMPLLKQARRLVDVEHQIKRRQS